MGIIRRGILGGFSGKVANVVGSSWKGISVIKSLPLSVANPRTAAQVAQRDRFKAVVKVALAILTSVIKPMWDRFAQQQSGFNAFVSENISIWGTATLPDNPELLKISQGRMEVTPITSIAKGAGDSIDIVWADDIGQGYKLATDHAIAVVWNIDNSTVVGYNDGVTNRADLTMNLEVEGDASLDEYYVYLAFRRTDGTVVSNNSVATLNIP